MFDGFLHELRGHGVPVATDEWLGLQDALEQDVAGSSLAGFYLAARSLLVKSERFYDAYDRAFEAYFSGLRPADDTIDDAVWEWLAGGDGPRLTPEQRARLDAMMEEIGAEELRRRFEERLANQDAAHRGGDRHIGTDGTSPFGHSGVHPGGIRIGGQGRNRSAAQIAGERRWRAYASDETLGVREFGLALRRLRRLSTAVDGPETELDVEGTIAATADSGGRLEVVMRRPRRNSVRVLLLLDIGGSMDDHAALIDRLFSAVHQAHHFRDLVVRFFHNCVYDNVYLDSDMDPRSAESTTDLLNRLDPDYRLIVVGDGCMAPGELTESWGAIDYHQRNAEAGHIWLSRLARRFPRSVWLNPVPRSWWDTVHGAPTLGAIRTIFPMHELSLDGLSEAVEALMTPAGR